VRRGSKRGGVDFLEIFGIARHATGYGSSFRQMEIKDYFLMTHLDRGIVGSAA